MTGFAIREERPADHERVRALIAAAFGREDEAGLTDALRARHGARAVSLVAIDGAQALHGHILLTPARIDGARPAEGFALAPVSVAPEWQGKGAGSALCRAALDRARERAAAFVMLVGHPDYYPRFGFRPAAELGVTCPFEGVPDAAFMIAVLDGAAMQGVRGTGRFDPLFDGA